MSCRSALVARNHNESLDGIAVLLDLSLCETCRGEGDSPDQLIAVSLIETRCNRPQQSASLCTVHSFVLALAEKALRVGLHKTELSLGEASVVYVLLIAAVLALSAGV